MPRRLLPIALRIVVLVASLEASALAAEPEPTPRARAHFKAGVEHLQRRSYSYAYREFKASYAETPTWKVLGNIGITADKLERDGEAIDALQKYLDEGKKGVSAREASQAQDDLARLRRGIATVTVAAPGSFWIVDTRVDAGGPVINQYGPFDEGVELRVRAGEHEFKLDSSSIEAPAWSARLLPGDRATHRFEVPSELAVDVPGAPAPIPPPRVDTGPPSHTAAYLAWGAGALGVGVTTVLYFESRRMQDDADAAFEENCPNGLADPSDLECANALADDASAANWRTATLVTGCVALGALIGGTVLFLLDGSAARADATEASIQPWASPTRIGITGTF